MRFQKEAYFTIPKWEEMPFLVHGFGDKNWQFTHFQEHPQLRHFKVVFLHQIHSDILHIVDEVPRGVLSGDALLTVRSGILLVIKTADCLPVLIVDPQTKAVAAIHCGWRSIVKMLVRKVVQSLEAYFRSDPASLLVALGPCIGKDCYEVGEDVREVFDKRGLATGVFDAHPRHPGKYYLDLRLATTKQLLEGGVKSRHISLIDLCTHCDENLFSCRRCPENEGRMLSFIGKSSL